MLTSQIDQDLHARVESNDVSWSVFIIDWQRYKRMTKLDNESQSTICDKLREAYSPVVRELLYNYVGSAALESGVMTETK